MTHHAYLYLSSDLEISVLPLDVQTKDIDTLHIIVDSFGIADAKNLIQQASVRPVNSAHRTFVVSARVVTHEAQNALLKLFEEPPVSTIFHIILQNERVLIPTLRSRLIILQNNSESTEVRDCNTDFVEFFTADYKKRFELITSKIKNKDLLWVDNVIRSLDIFMKKNIDISLANKKTILLVDTYIHRRGSSKKMLMEELALALPVGVKLT